MGSVCSIKAIDQELNDLVYTVTGGDPTQEMQKKWHRSAVLAGSWRRLCDVGGCAWSKSSADLNEHSWKHRWAATTHTQANEQHSTFTPAHTSVNTL